MFLNLQEPNHNILKNGHRFWEKSRLRLSSYSEQHSEVKMLTYNGHI